jgi:hypothetical protein
MKRAWIVCGLLGVSASLAAIACGGKEQAAVGTGTTKVSPGGTRDQSKWPVDDKSMCDWKNKPELQISETNGPGALKPNVRRVYKVVGEGESRHKTLICREIDTNLDGIKDVVRTFNAKGEAVREEADRNYDGKIDVWISFVDGRIAQEDIDTNGDGKPDVWKFYLDGQLQRIRRDTNFDGKPDVWEIYTRGKLERQGIDTNFDGHVDRWDRDEVMKYEAEEAEKKTREQMAAAAAAQAAEAGAPPQQAAADAGAGDAGKKPK